MLSEDLLWRVVYLWRVPCFFLRLPQLSLPRYFYGWTQAHIEEVLFVSANTVRAVLRRFKAGKALTTSGARRARGKLVCAACPEGHVTCPHLLQVGGSEACAYGPAASASSRRSGCRRWLRSVHVQDEAVERLHEVRRDVGLEGPVTRLDADKVCALPSLRLHCAFSGHEAMSRHKTLTRSCGSNLSTKS